MNEPLKIEELFDEVFYKAQLNRMNIVSGEKNLLEHYKNKGKYNHFLSPSPFFDTEYYLVNNNIKLKKNSDGTDAAPIDHFIEEGQGYGEGKGLPTSIFFDPDYYLKDIGVRDHVKANHKKGASALGHYIYHGQFEWERSPSIYFSNSNYSKHIDKETADKLVKENISLFKNFVRELTADEFSPWLSIYRLAKLLDGVKYPLLKFWIKRYQKGIISPEGIDQLVKELNPLNMEIFESLEKLVLNNIDSATAIACLSKASFVSMAKKAGMAEGIISSMYSNAKKMATSTAQIYIDKKQENSPYLKNLSFSKDSANLINDKGPSGSYQDLFGQLDYFADTTNSVHSPAAYFYELMQIVNDESNFVVSDKMNWSLKARRPDLYEIPLNTENTLMLVPHVKIANYVLSRFYLNCLGEIPDNINGATENFIDRHESYVKQAFRLIGETKEKSNAPYVLSLEQIRAYLTTLNTNLFEAYSLFGFQRSVNSFLAGEKIFSSEGETQKAPDLRLVLEYLNLSLSEYEWIKDNLLLVDMSLFEGQTSVEMREFCQKTGISAGQIKEMLRYHEEVDENQREIYQSHYIHNTGKMLPIIDITLDIDKKAERINHLSGARLARIRFFINIANKLNWRFADAQFAFGTVFDTENNNLDDAHLQKIASIKWVKENSSLSFIAACSLIKGLSEQNFRSLLLTNSSDLKLDVSLRIEAKDTDLLDSIQKILANEIAILPQSALLKVELLCRILTIKPIELGLMINSLKDNFEMNKPNNLKLASCLYRFANVAKFCQVSLLDLRNIHLIISGESSLEGSLKTLSNKIDEKNPSEAFGYIVKLFNVAQWIKKNNFVIKDFLYLTCNIQSEADKKKHQEKTDKLFEKLKEKKTLAKNAVHELKLSIEKNHRNFYVNSKIPELDQIWEESLKSLVENFEINMWSVMMKTNRESEFRIQIATNYFQSDFSLKRVIDIIIEKTSLVKDFSHEFNIEPEMAKEFLVNDLLLKFLLEESEKISKEPISLENKVHAFLRKALVDKKFITEMDDKKHDNFIEKKSGAILNVLLPIEKYKNAADIFLSDLLKKMDLIVEQFSQSITHELVAQFETNASVVDCIMQKFNTDVMDIKDFFAGNPYSLEPIFKIFKLKEVLGLAEMTGDLKSGVHDEVPLLLNILDPSFGKAITFSHIEKLSTFRNLQNRFHSKNCDFICAYNLADKSLLLSLMGWEERLFDKICVILNLHFNKIYSLLNFTAEEVAVLQKLAGENFEKIQSLEIKNDRYKSIFFTREEILGIKEKLQNVNTEEAQKINEKFVFKNSYDSSAIESLSRILPFMEYYNKLGEHFHVFELFWQLSKADQKEQPKIQENLAGLLGSMLATKQPEIYDKMACSLEEKKRNVLLNKSISLLSRDGRELGIQKIQALSEYLLIDLEMSGEYSTSFIVEGTASLQRFIERSRLGIEKYVKCMLPVEQFRLIEHYRVWEANRKVLLYPENYLEPELRKDQTPEFKAFTDVLLQGNLDKDQIDDAFRKYIHQLSILGDLVYVDAIHKDQSNEYCLFARTQRKPYVYYYRKMMRENFTQLKFSNWNKINLRINASEIGTVYAFNRLFIFWGQLKNFKTRELNAGKPGNEPSDYVSTEKFDCQMYFSYQNNHGLWEDPESLTEKYPNLFGGLPFNQFKMNKLSSEHSNISGIFAPFIRNFGSRFSAVVFDNNLYLLNEIRPGDEKNAAHEKESFNEGMTGLLAFKKNGEEFQPQHHSLIFSDWIDYYRPNSRMTAIANNRLNVLIKGNNGIDVFGFRSLEKPYDVLGLPKVISPYSDLFSTCLVGIDNKIFICGIGSERVMTCFYDYSNPKKGFSNIIEINAPMWGTQDPYWKEEQHYKTFKALEVAGKLFFLAKAKNGLEVFYYDTKKTESGFIQVEMHPKIFSAEYWSEPKHAQTIRAVAIGAQLYVGGIDETLNFKTFWLNSNSPQTGWSTISDATDLIHNSRWENKEFHGPLKMFSVNNYLCILTRVSLGMKVHICDVTDKTANWQGVKFVKYGYMFSEYPDKTNADENYRNQQHAYYMRIQVVTFNKQLLLITNDDNSIRTCICQDCSSLDSILKTENWTKEQFDFASNEERIKIPVVFREGYQHIFFMNKFLHFDGIDIDIDFHNAQNKIELFHQNKFETSLQIKSLIENLDPTPLQLSRSGSIYQLNNCLMSGMCDDFFNLKPTSEEFFSPYANYFWETFFHGPLFVANALSANQKFEEARNWYHYIFNPNRIGAKFLFPPFNLLLDDHKNIEVTDKTILSRLNSDPFNPHVIAMLRPIAYMKMVVMKYIQNLINWGDALFSEDTRESITMAINLYLMANNLLGNKPQALGRTNASNRTITFDQPVIGSNAVAINDVTAILLKRIESDFILPDSSFNGLNLFFSVPENKEFIAYWDKTSDRLFKIRHALNINGLRRELDLFSPEIDPRQLVRAAASGGGINLKDFLSRPSPIYRFEYLLATAKDFVTHLIQLGNSLQSLLERYDNEKLSYLIQQHQSRMLDLVDRIKEQQIDEAIYVSEQTKQSLEIANTRKKYYGDLVDKGLISEEISAKDKRNSAQSSSKIANHMQLSASGVALIPEVCTGTAGLGPYVSTMMVSGAVLSKAYELAATIVRMEADAYSFSAETLLQDASYKLREQEWQQQQDEAQNQCAQLEQQLSISKIHVDIAKQEYINYQEAVKQQQEIMQFYQSKFTNIELYRWMMNQLTTVYKQFYDMALDLAKSAERSYQYELAVETKKFIGNNHYSFFRKGLLAGELLSVELAQMQKSYLEENKRWYELERTISLKPISLKEGQPKDTRLEDFKKTGEVIFNLDNFEENLGLGDRRIKRISISIPSLAKPYQNIYLSLQQIKNTNTSWRSGETIVFTAGMNETGLFQPSLQDPRYLPFEGTNLEGSEFILKIGLAGEMNSEGNQAILNSISNVLITVQYISRPKVEKQANLSIRPSFSVRSPETIVPQPRLVTVSEESRPKVEIHTIHSHSIFSASQDKTITKNSSSTKSVGNFDGYIERKFSENSVHKGFSKSFYHSHAGQDIQNSAETLFLDEKALNFQNWYHPEICHYLLQMADNKAKCIRVIFHDANEGNNTKTFKNQLLQLVMLSHWLKRPALFISKEPGADNHFICGLVKEGNLLLINPLGMTEQDTCYQTLAELKQEKTIKAVWISSNALQKRQYEAEGLVSCGPIALELATHILTNFTPEELDIFWENNLQTEKYTTHDASGLTYYGINIETLLPDTLKGLRKATDKSSYESQVCGIRQKHCRELQALPVEHANNFHTTVEDYLSNCKEGGPHQLAFNALITEKTLNNIDELPAYQLLKQEINLQATKSIPQKTEAKSNKILLQKNTTIAENDPKSEKIDPQIPLKSPKNLYKKPESSTSDTSIHHHVKR